MNLEINITTLNETDIDNNPIIIKVATAKIGGVLIYATGYYDNIPDVIIENLFKEQLKSMGYLWNN